MKRFVFSILAIAFWGNVAMPQCPNCPPNGVIPVHERPDPDAHGWYVDPGNAQLLILYWRGEMVGTLDPLTGVWHTAGKSHSVNLVRTFGLFKEKFVQDTPAPKPKECICKPGECHCEKCPNDCVASALPSYATHGVYRNATSIGESFVVNGEPATRSAALNQLGADRIPDDSARPRLVIVGTPSARAKVLDEWAHAQQLQPFKDKMIVQSYSPDHEHVRGMYSAFSDVSIYLVASDGKLITWQANYDGPDRLAKGLEAGLRKVDPSFNPQKTPDLSRPLSSNDLIIVGLCCLGAAGIAIVNKK